MKQIFFSLLFLVLPSASYAEDFTVQIDKRQATFESIEVTSEYAEQTLSGSKTDWEKLTRHSQKLEAHSHALLTLFPQGSHVGSKAKSDIWSKPSKFNQLLIQMNQGFQELYKASLAQDINRAEIGLKNAQDTCRNCHRSYRSRW
ncbi:cytochrome c [Vibrio sp. Isolate23]|uniref:c-type cytochrome n=1 Tax=unclassified Vibrio TaxID=2614977 RepID=UPI001EFD52B4|nr:MULTISPECIES: cytochrome c [unclassified Vibrio]MCG9676792.1 cytochrome c [Vibrio sp. Isolate24]MCG9681913.1 cytochrome c [Vibrio sp. Isolate23]